MAQTTIAVSKDSSKTTSGTRYVAKRHPTKVHSTSVASTYTLPGEGGTGPGLRAPRSNICVKVS